MNIETETTLTEKSLPPYLGADQFQSSKLEMNTETELIEAERVIITRKLQQYGNSYNGKKMVAQELGISIRTLYRKIDKFQILV